MDVAFVFYELLKGASYELVLYTFPHKNIKRSCLYQIKADIFKDKVCKMCLRTTIPWLTNDKIIISRGILSQLDNSIVMPSSDHLQNTIDFNVRDILNSTSKQSSTYKVNLIQNCRFLREIVSGFWWQRQLRFFMFHIFLFKATPMSNFSS